MIFVAKETGKENNMRLIDADALIKKIFPYDVVDKKCYTINAKMIHEAIKESPTVDIKTEVAREIFAEMEGTLKAATWLVKADFSSTVKERELKEKCCRDFLEYITELKNKYTKEGVGE